MTNQATEISNAIIETLTNETQPVSRVKLITSVYQKTKHPLHDYNLNMLIGSGKIERTSQGYYQLKRL